MTLHAHAWGDEDAPLVVCLHGVRNHGLVFRHLAERMTGMRVLAPDLRGHGRSPWEPPWRLEDHLDDVRELLGAAVPAALVGHSFGARLVMELRAVAPGLVRRAVLLDPAIWVPPAIALDVADRERRERSYASVAEAIEARPRFSRLLSTPRALLEEEMENHLVEGEDGRFRYRYSQAAVVAAFGELARTPPPQSALLAPTLLVRGEQTDVVPDELVHWYSEIGDLLRVVAVPGGHNVLWDAFEATADAVLGFLEDAGAERARRELDGE